MSKLYFKGDIVFLYVKFFDQNGNVAKKVENPKVRILHSKNCNIYEDLPWTKMNKLMSENEFFVNYPIPFDSECGMFDIVYHGEIDGKVATIVENFHVIEKSQTFSNAIKLYGYVDDIANQIPLAFANIEIMSMDGLYYTQSYTHENGYWEAYLYPGDYMCSFKRDGYKEQVTNIQLGSDTNEIQFNNISLESEIARTNGNGLCKISDSVILKNGIPLDGLKIDAYNIIDPTTLSATCLTNNRGVWEINLDPGYYFLKMSGNSMNMEFDKTFRLKINDDSTYDIEDMDNNKAIAQDEILGPGEGSQTYKDIISDGRGNPIIDVQVNAYKNGKLIAQTYTNAAGEYELFLDKGEYTIDIYHPSFKEIPEFKITL
jgi:hypothetical protein